MKSDWTVVTVPVNAWAGSIAITGGWGECYQWCMDIWGRNNEWVYLGPGKFHFKNEADAVFFKLKWL